MNDIKKLTILITAVTAARILAATSFPLVAGEAYYWLWGQYADFGYVDHPPMVAWMARISFGWVCASELAARSSAIIQAVFSTVAMFALARTFFPEGKIAWRTAALFSVIPVFDLNGIILTPDNSLFLFMILFWRFFWLAANSDRMLLWLASGVCAGLALLSKFHAWVLLPPVWVFLAASPQHRRLLARPGPYVAAILALIVLSPNLFWNAQNEWANYAFQWKRSSLPGSSLTPKHFLHFLAMPLLSLSPLVYAGTLVGSVAGWRRWRRDGDVRMLYLLFAGAPLPLFLGALSTLVAISPHWPAAGYVPLLLIAVALMERGDLYRSAFAKIVLGFKAQMASALTLTAIAHLGPYVISYVPDSVEYSPLDKINAPYAKRQFVGWKELGKVTAQRLEKLQKDEAAPAVLMGDTWHLASQLAFYSGKPREAFVMGLEGANNFEIWRRQRGGLDNVNAIVVLKNKTPEKPRATFGLKYADYFDDVRPLFRKVNAEPSLFCYSDGDFDQALRWNVKKPTLQEFMIFRGYGLKPENLGLVPKTVLWPKE